MTATFGIRADTSAMKKLASDFRRAAPASYRAIQKTLRKTALEVAADAKERSSFSSHISSSGKVKMRGLNAVVDFGGNSSWWAVPIENAGKGFVSHPLWGRLPMTNKNSHAAFLHPAFNAAVPAYIEELKIAIQAAIEEALGGK